MTRGITILGLGPGDPQLLTKQAQNVIDGLQEIYLRTKRHPTVEALPKKIEVHSFDHLYDQAEKFEDVYSQIIDQVLALGERPEGVTYAVPGSPFVAEATCPGDLSPGKGKRSTRAGGGRIELL